MCAGSSDQLTQRPNPDDPARDVRRLLTALVVLALAAAGGAFALSQRGGTSAPRHPVPSLFPDRFSEAGFLAGTALLVTSYDADTSAARTTGPVDAHGVTYVIARCSVGTIRIAIGGLTSARPCTGAPVGVVAVNLSGKTQLTATVSARQPERWGVALYR